jgi:hypothetical protein
MNLENRKEQARGRAKGTAFQLEGMASTEVLR